MKPKQPVYVGTMAGGRALIKGRVMDVILFLHHGYIGAVPCFIRRRDDRAWVVCIPRVGPPRIEQELGAPTDPPQWATDVVGYLSNYTKAGAA